MVLTARPTVDAVFRAMREGPMALGATLRIKGDAMLAQALGEVARAMNWDVEEDLSRVVGDAAAHRAGQFLRECPGACGRGWQPAARCPYRSPVVGKRGAGVAPRVRGMA